MRNIVSAAFLMFAIGGCDFLSFWQGEAPDNVIEEKVEEEIKELCGKDIDLSPITGEEKMFKIKEKKDG